MGQMKLRAYQMQVLKEQFEMYGQVMPLHLFEVGDRGVTRYGHEPYTVIELERDIELIKIRLDESKVMLSFHFKEALQYLIPDGAIAVKAEQECSCSTTYLMRHGCGIAKGGKCDRGE